MEMTAAKLRELPVEELQIRAAELQKEMFDLRLKTTTKEQENTSLIRKSRRDFARLQTILNEKKQKAAS